jgi:hypothetical protein
LFLSERFTFLEYLFIGVIFLCGILIRVDEKFSLKAFRDKYRDLWVGVMCMLFLALSGVSIKFASTSGSYWNNMLWINLITSMTLSLTIPFFFRDALKTPVRKYLGALGYAISGSTGRLLMFLGLAINATVATAIISLPLSMLMTIPIAYISPQLLEKHSTKIYIYRLLVAAVMIACSVKLSLR